MGLIMDMLEIPARPMSISEYLTYGMVVVILAGFVAYICYYLFTNLDHSSSKLIKDSGEIIGMEYTGEEEETIADVALTVSTDGLIPPSLITDTIESDWEIQIKRNGSDEIIKLEVDRNQYKKHRVGDIVNIEAHLYWITKNYSPWQIV